MKNQTLRDSLFAPIRLFASPSMGQLDVSRERVRQRLQLQDSSVWDKVPIRAARQTYFAGFRLLYPVAFVLLAFVVVLSVKTFHDNALARIEASEGSLNLVSGNGLRALREKDSIWQEQIIRSGGGPGGVLRLADESQLELNSETELSLERANDGIRIRLLSGGVIVEAAKQHSGHLYVQTKDVTVSVTGTVFFVSAASEGSRVVVVEGAVNVRQGSIQKSLSAGEEMSTDPLLEWPPMQDVIAWSRNAVSHVARLQSVIPAQVDAPARRLEFKVTSIRAEGKPRNYLRFQAEGNRFVSEGTSLAALIRYAYGVESFQVLGGPDWALDRDTQFYVEATSEGAATKAQFRQMLQSLLADRFQLKLTHLSRQTAGYILRMGKSGPKFRATKGAGPEGCFPFPAECTRVTMGGFADYLSAVVFKAPVVDATSLQGLFDLTLQWQPDRSQFGGNGGQDFFAGRRSDPSIFDAVQEQLGLTLESSIVPTEILVIDHADMPSEN